MAKNPPAQAAAKTKAPRAPKAAPAAPKAESPAMPPADPPAADTAAMNEAAAAQEHVQAQATPAGGEPTDPRPFVDTVRAEPLPADTPASVFRLERARDLLELARGEEGAQVSKGIQAFKDADGRTMKVVVRDGSLYKQEV